MDLGRTPGRMDVAGDAICGFIPHLDSVGGDVNNCGIPCHGCILAPMNAEGAHKGIA